MVGPLVGLELGTAGRAAAKKLAKKAIKSVAKYGKAAKAAKEANQTSNYSKSLIQAINTAEQLIALFKGQQELLGFNEKRL